MFSNNNPKALVHLPRSQQPSPSDRLPEGECRFILPDTGADGSRSRCTCVSFTLNKDVPGSQCGCGHQAWHHVRQSTANSEYVSLEDYHRLLDRFQRVEETARKLQDELSRERRERDKANKDLIHMLRGNYNNMAYLRYYIDEKLEILRLHCEDKNEGVLDKAHGANEELEKLKTRLADIDESIIRLEDRVDSGRWHSRSLTPVHETYKMDTTPTAPVPSIPAVLPIRTEDKHPNAWDVRVILVPSRNQTHAFMVDSLAYKRCQSRGLQQDMHMQDRSAAQFVQCVEAGFATILRGRKWIPLMCMRSSDMSLSQIPPQERNPSYWNYTFLESQCMASDKVQGEVIYIALEDGDLSWSDIRSLPRVFGSDEVCWNQNPELDAPPSTPMTAHKMDYKMTSSTSDLRIDSDSIYEHSPPPYTSGGSSVDMGLPSALGVLAGAATYLADQTGPRSPSATGAPPRTPSDHHSTPAPSITSLMNPILEDDEHRDKRTKRGGLRPEPASTGLPPPPPVVSSPPQQTKYYYSGRSKRKMPTGKGKAKEPLDWRVSEMKIGNPAKGLFHRHTSDKEKHAQAQQAQQQQPEPGSRA